MRSVPTLFAVSLCGILASCGKGQNPDHTSRRTLPSAYVEGSFVITTDVTTSDSQLASSANAAGSALGCKVSAPNRINWGDQSLDGSGVLSEGLLNTYNVKYAGCDFTKEGTKAILGQLSADALILSAEAESISSATPLAVDPLKKFEDHLGLIRRDQACALAEKTGEPVIVAVVDSGVFTEHPDLKDVMLRDANGQIIGANFVGASSQMPPDAAYDDQNGHGTHVAGLIGAASNNGIGVAGVAGCANVKIMPVRVLNADGKGSSIEIERGVKWAADHGAQIINLSLGFTGDMAPGSSNFYRSIYSEMAQRDVIVFAAAGNDGFVNGSDDPDQPGSVRYGFPAAYDGVIAVAATNNQGQLTSFSNRGPRVAIAAPGYAVLSTLKSGDYGRMSGTSMASPVAAGAYALALATARAGLGSLDRVDSKTAEAMLKTSTVDGIKLSGDDVEAAGVINVEKLVAAMKAKYPKPVATAPAPVDPIVTPVVTPVVTPPQPTQPVATQPTQPTQPIATQPTQPTTPDQPAPKPFGFAGLKSGDTPAWPQELALANLPTGTSVVYFYWGRSYWAFTKAYVKDLAQLTVNGKWYLYGNRTLKAVAYSKAGARLATVSIDLQGY